MKKRVITLLLAAVFAVMCLTSCATKLIQIPDEPIGDPPVEQPDYAQLYSGVLEEYYNIIQNADALELVEGKIGVIETAQYLGDAALRTIGYIIQDINGDDVAELLIGVSSEDGYTANDIYAVYAIKDAKPYFVVEGRSRSSYALMENGHFYYYGSNGASYSIFAEYALTTSAELESKDFYFTYEKNNNYEDVGFFHNTTGVYDMAAAEELKIDADAFWALDAALAEKTVKLSFTPFSEFEPSGADGGAPQPDATAEAQFTGNWVGEANGFDGTTYTLFVDVLSDGTASYKCGPAYSEILVDYRGTWALDSTGQNVVFALTDVYEGDSFNGEYKWSLNGGSLTLQHISGDAFLYGAEGKSFNFN